MVTCTTPPFRAAVRLNSGVRRHTMHSWQRAIGSIVVLLAVGLSLPGLVYVAGLLKVNGRPTPADSNLFSQDAITSAWLKCQEKAPISVQPINPWGFTGRFLFGDPLRRDSGERAAWRIASTHNAANHVVGGLWWHTSGVALTIWITRHWSADQIGATLVRDNLCK